MRDRLAIVALLALASLPVTAPLAQATYDPLGSGTAKPTLDKRLAAFLKANGIAFGATAPAKRQGKALTLPVAGGKLDPTAARLEAETEGTISFEGARRSVPLRNLTVKANRAPLIAKLATRLNEKLRPDTPFGQGQPLSILVTKAQPLLDALHVPLSPIFPAEHSGGAFSFPILAGGAISPAASLGTPRSGGEVEFLQLGAVSADPSARTISLAGVPLNLQAATADAFNRAFAEGKAVFGAGETLGVAGFSAQAQ